VSTRRAGILPYEPAALFDVAADIERYPEVFTGWLEVRVLRRDDDRCVADQVLGFGPIRLAFASTAEFHRPAAIDITSTAAAFRNFRISWRFAPWAPRGCRVEIEAEIELRSPLQQQLLKRALPIAIDEVWEAFAARAHAILGGAAGPQTPARDP
jgi:coenzyme Q-binding protein COQ10